MSSCTDVTGNDDGTTITGVIWPSIRIGVRSFCESKGIRLCRFGAAVMAALLATSSM